VIGELVSRSIQTLREEGPLSALRKITRHVRTRFLIEGAVIAFRRGGSRMDVADAIEYVYRFNFLGVVVSPFQFREELRDLLAELERRRPQTILEIGTCVGGTLFLFTRVAADDALVISLDLPHGEFGGGYAPARSRLYRSFAISGQRLELVRSDSHLGETKMRIQELLADRQIDFLFIDGDHRGEGVAADLEMYGPLVAADGLIGFHDIVPGPPEAVGGVPTFWSELKRGRRFSEIVRNWNQGSAGIGLIQAHELEGLFATVATPRPEAEPKTK
jgi:cephalosporin hydroxylase